MAPPIVERFTGDLIPAADHSDILPYIETGTYRVNTSELCIQGVSSTVSVIDTAGYFKPIRIVNRDGGGLLFYASNGTTQIAILDENGNLGIKGMVYTL